MDPLVDFYNIDRSGWHALIGLIDDTHTFVSNLFSKKQHKLTSLSIIQFLS